ncbi:hypothetical protein PhCBS80983_g05565 [Powellomyces hirtus]|uniref:GST C-terminal domain-containing protein n=1 Tax=Powellomyces hirtus TaxID=109895 RepID=A0A507DVB9_9FUNG|nr:hypothetical protein PhCBS80983_g05565 [Powellomyces hirtus]
MDSLMKLGGSPIALAAQGVCAAALVAYVIKRVTAKPRKSLPNPSNIVILYQFVAPKDVPVTSMSPPCIKLEAYLRLAKVPYIDRRVVTAAKSPKKTAPYAEYNGVTKADSNVIIDWLEEIGVSPGLDGHLTELDRAQSEAFRYLIEEGMYWHMVYSRWQHEPNWARTRAIFFATVPAWMRTALGAYVRGLFVKGLYSQHVGRHTFEEVLQMNRKCVEALSDLLGGKKYFLSDTRPSLLDATAYAHLSNMLYVEFPDKRISQQIATKKNLVAYCHRMTEEVFPERLN